LAMDSIIENSTRIERREVGSHYSSDSSIVP